MPTKICLFSREVFDRLKQYEGKDRVKLAIPSHQGTVIVDFPNLHTAFCPMLKKKLVELVGEDGLAIQREVNDPLPNQFQQAILRAALLNEETKIGGDGMPGDADVLFGLRNTVVGWPLSCCL